MSLINSPHSLMMSQQVSVSLMNGRPGSSGPSRTLTEFTLARYVRLRMRKLRIKPGDERTLSANSLFQSGGGSGDSAILRRYFYSISKLTIGGQCHCNGHATECDMNEDTMVRFHTSRKG